MKLPSDVKWSDDDIAKAAINRLAWDSTLPKDAIKISVQDGRVTLTGKVEWHFEHDAAAQDIRLLWGVVGVSNQITLRPRVNTYNLTSDISTALHRSWFAPNGIKVAADGGKVTLTSHVKSWSERELTGSTAWGAPGATDVENYLIIDIFSRRVVGWCVADTESAALFKPPFEDAVAKHAVAPGQLTLHADRGPSMKARAYDPSLGRFQRTDPAGLASDTNLYAYATEDPVNGGDPSGRDDCPQCQSMDGPPAPDEQGPGPAIEVDGDDFLSFTQWTECQSGSPGDGSRGITVSPTKSLGLIPLFFFSGGPQGAGASGGGGGGKGPPSIGRNCSVAPASAGQYAAATADSVAMTAEFFSGLGDASPTFGPDSATSQVMGQSAGGQAALGQYQSTGATSGLYSFGLSGLVQAGANPVAQFVGSFRWSISGNILSVTNTSSFKSLAYDHGPQWQRSQFAPMGNTHQVYHILIGCY